MRALGEQFDTKLAANTLNITATFNQKLNNVVANIAKMPPLIADFDMQLEMVKARLSEAISERSDHHLAFDTRLDAAEARLSSAISEWGDAHHENTVTHDLDRQLPECKVWQSLLKSFDDLEDNITNEVHELKELSLCTQSTSSSVAGTPSGSGTVSTRDVGSFPSLCANFRSGTCKAGQNCKSLHIAEPGNCSFNEEHIKHIVKHWGAGLRGNTYKSVKEKIDRINYCSVQASRAVTAEIRQTNNEAIRRMAADAGLLS